MAYFPFFIDIEQKKCLVVGGGTVALRKVEVLLPYGAILIVVAPSIHEDIIAMAKEDSSQLVLNKREFEDKDLDGIDFCIAATQDEELNNRISSICKQKNILVNVVDVKEECSFIVPAIIHNEAYDIAVSSGGKSPIAASYLKRRIRESIPQDYGVLVEQLGIYRDYVKEQIPNQQIRAEVFRHLFDNGLENNCNLTKDMVNEVVMQYMK